MTALDRARGWFIAPPPPSSSSPTDWSAAPPDPAGRDPDPPPENEAATPARVSRPGDPTASAAGPSRPGDPSASGAPSPRPSDSSASAACLSRPGEPSASAARFSPQADPSASVSRVSSPGGLLATSPPDGALVAAPLTGETAPLRSRGGKRRTRPSPRADDRLSVADGATRRPAARGGWQPPLAGEWIAESTAEASLAITSAAVLGRAGEVEPVAAALALALRLQTRAKAAAVAVAGAVPPEVEGASSGAAARRLGSRLEDHGLEAHVRGRLAWVRLEPGDPQFAATARRVTLVAAPAVLAVTAARTDAVDEALNEQDLLVIVTDDPEGPLAQLAAAGLAGVPIVTVRPLGRGPARALARAGVRPARSLRQLLTTVPEATR